MIVAGKKYRAKNDFYQVKALNCSQKVITRDKVYAVMIDTEGNLVIRDDTGDIVDSSRRLNEFLRPEPVEESFSLVGNWIKCIDTGFINFKENEWYQIADNGITDGKGHTVSSIFEHFDLTDIRSEKPETKSPAEIEYEKLQEQVSALQGQMDVLKEAL